MINIVNHKEYWSKEMIQREENIEMIEKMLSESFNKISENKMFDKLK